MSVTKILCTRQILGSFATTMTGPHGVRHHMSKACIKAIREPSATYRLVHASRAIAPTQEDVEVSLASSKQQLKNLPLRRTEMEQRRMTRVRSLEALQKIHKPKASKMHRVPFVNTSSAGGEYRSVSPSRYANVEDLLKATSDPRQLATELVDLARELNLEKRENQRLMKDYQYLLEQVTTKHGRK